MKKPGPFSLLLLAALALSCNSKPREIHDPALATSPKPEQVTATPQPEAIPAGPLPEKTIAAYKPTAGSAIRSAKNRQKNRPPQTQPPLKILSDPYAPAVPETEIAEALTLEEVYRHFEKAPQTFSVIPGRDTTLVCREGTSLKIPANAFVSDKTGKPVAGPVQLSVKEFYRLSDILLANLSTKSGNENLETAGMIQVVATAGNSNCLLMPGRQIEIGFPFEVRQEAMQLFGGKWHGNSLDWQLAQNPAEIKQVAASKVRKSPKVLKPDKMPAFRGGEKALEKYFAKNVRYPLTPLKAGTEGIVELRMQIARYGKVQEVRVEKGLDPLLDKAAALAVMQMPNWKPARAEKKPVAANQTVSVPFRLEGMALDRKTRARARKFEKHLKGYPVSYRQFREQESFSTSDTAYKAEFEKNVTQANLQETGVQNLNRYLFSTTELGWINCDRFYQNKAPKIDYVVNHQGKDSASVKVVFHAARAILPGSFRGTQYAVTNVPLGEKVTIVAFKTEGKNVLLAVKETTISRTGEAALAFEPVTLARLQTEMEKLNKLK